MTIQKRLQNLANNVRRFTREPHGHVAMTFAYALIPIMGTIGAAVD